jgi:hypothetical protein
LYEQQHQAIPRKPANWIGGSEEPRSFRTSLRTRGIVDLMVSAACGDARKSFQGIHGRALYWGVLEIEEFSY